MFTCAGSKETGAEGHRFGLNKSVSRSVFQLINLWRLNINSRLARGVQELIKSPSLISFEVGMEEEDQIVI